MQLFQDPGTKPPFCGTWSQVHHSGYISFCVLYAVHSAPKNIHTTDTEDMVGLCVLEKRPAHVFLLSMYTDGVL